MGVLEVGGASIPHDRIACRQRDGVVSNETLISSLKDVSAERLCTTKSLDKQVSGPTRLI